MFHTQQPARGQPQPGSPRQRRTLTQHRVELLVLEAAGLVLIERVKHGASVFISDVAEAERPDGACELSLIDLARFVLIPRGEEIHHTLR